jgi:hypothetical protein
MAFNNAGLQVPPSDAADETAENFDRVNAISPCWERPKDARTWDVSPERRAAIRLHQSGS